MTSSALLNSQLHWLVVSLASSVLATLCFSKPQIDSASCHHRQRAEGSSPQVETSASWEVALLPLRSISEFSGISFQQILVLLIFLFPGNITLQTLGSEGLGFVHHRSSIIAVCSFICCSNASMILLLDSLSIVHKSLCFQACTNTASSSIHSLFSSKELISNIFLFKMTPSFNESKLHGMLSRPFPDDILLTWPHFTCSHSVSVSTNSQLSSITYRWNRQTSPTCPHCYSPTMPGSDGSMGRYNLKLSVPESVMLSIWPSSLSKILSFSVSLPSIPDVGIQGLNSHLF